MAGRRAAGMTFGMSVGTLVLAVDLMFLALYVFSCHSLRHLVGGGQRLFLGLELASRDTKRGAS